jgi:hypothetical protein
MAIHDFLNVESHACIGRTPERKDLKAFQEISQVLEECSVDDAGAMQKICNILHRRRDLLTEYFTAKEYFHLGILVDKYDLSAAFEPFDPKGLRLPKQPAPVEEITCDTPPPYSDGVSIQITG